MYNLHIHTTFSDGKDAPEQIIEKAEKLGVQAISFTDHDNCNVYESLTKDAVNSYSGDIVIGCEIKCVHGETPIELLAYGYNIQKLKGTGLLSTEKKVQIQQKYLDHLKEVCKKEHIIIDDSINITRHGQFAGSMLYSTIVDYPINKKYFGDYIWDSPAAFYRRVCCEKSSPFYINEAEDFLKAEEVIDIIHKANGLAFLAHLSAYNVEDKYAFLNSLLELTRLDGIECSHPTMVHADRVKLKEIAKENGLYISGGSDYHGDNLYDGGFEDGTRLVTLEKSEIDWIKNCIYNK